MEALMIPILGKTEPFISKSCENCSSPRSLLIAPALKIEPVLGMLELYGNCTRPCKYLH